MKWFKNFWVQLAVAVFLSVLLEWIFTLESVGVFSPAKTWYILLMRYAVFTGFLLMILSGITRRWWFGQQLYVQIFISIVIGIMFGIALKERVNYIAPFGDIFIRLLKMLIVPLTFLTLISGVNKLDSIKSLRSIGGMTLLYYALSSIVAAGIGMAIALMIKPGQGMEMPQAAEQIEQAEEFNFIQNVVEWVPTNPIEALAETSMLQIIFFAIVIGIALLAMEKKGERLTLIINDGAEMMIMITEKVMWFAPYGILALIATMVSTLGFDMLAQVGKFVGAQYISLAILLIFFYPLVLKFIAKLNPWSFYRNVSPAMLVAASTTSSGATLPVSMGVSQDNMGASEKVWGFTLPLGATVNMNGMASVIGVIAVFSSYLYNVEITAGSMLQAIFLGLALSVGTAGVKGAGIVISTILLQTLNFPIEILVPIFASIWPLLDIGNTCCNVTGDLAGTALISSKFGLLDKNIFDDKNAHRKV